MLQISPALKDITPPRVVAEAIGAGELFVINHSGGKDSQAMSALLRNVIPAEQILVVHAELPDADWPDIPEHIETTIDPRWTLEYCRATKTFFDMVERRHAARPDAPPWPSPKYRQCTSDLKRGPIDKTIRHYLKAHPEFNGRVVHCIGIRAEESSSRAKANTWKHNKRESIAGREVNEWLPIHDLTTDDVFNAIRGAGQRPHWAYLAGMSRLSCSFCIMASKSDLKTAARLRPDLANRYIEIEERTGYTMKHDAPLRELCGIPIRAVTA